MGVESKLPLGLENRIFPCPVYTEFTAHGNDKKFISFWNHFARRFESVPSLHTMMS